MIRLIVVASVVFFFLSLGSSFPFTNQVDMFCNRVNEIKILPFKGEYVDDEVYNGLINLGKPAARCLVKKIVDNTVMVDPRKTPPYEGITVGDVALFVLLDITKQNLENILPPPVRDEYTKEGIYAYFRFVEKPENRKIIQKNAYNLVNEMIDDARGTHRR